MLDDSNPLLGPGAFELAVGGSVVADPGMRAGTVDSGYLEAEVGAADSLAAVAGTESVTVMMAGCSGSSVDWEKGRTTSVSGFHGFD